jgi:hypothetical protein
MKSIHFSARICGFLFLILALIFLVTSSQLSAQNSGDIEGEIEIWTAPALWGNGSFLIPIHIDTQGIAVGMDAGTEITNFSLITSCGNVEFGDVIDGSAASRYLTATLETQLECEKITIVRATGKLDGMITFDLTRNIVISDKKPIPLEIFKDQK